MIFLEKDIDATLKKYEKVGDKSTIDRHRISW